ncbi:hypothetical protein VCHA53O466_50229 [Vibrio chagasii]|nr:hypothetical protein VCHA53O466_50229 [Vibrio chagasii]
MDIPITGAERMFLPEGTMVSSAERKRYSREDLTYNVTEDILVAMEDNGIDSKELARRLSKSVSHIDALLSGRRNMTLGVLSDICFELGLKPQLSLVN